MYKLSLPYAYFSKNTWKYAHSPSKIKELHRNTLQNSTFIRANMHKFFYFAENMHTGVHIFDTFLLYMHITLLWLFPNKKSAHDRIINSYAHMASASRRRFTKCFSWNIWKYRPVDISYVIKKLPFYSSAGVGEGLSAAHKNFRLLLLPSGPDKVHGIPLRRTQTIPGEAIKGQWFSFLYKVCTF